MTMFSRTPLRFGTISSQALATFTLYVRSGGNDRRGDGLTPGTAFATPQRAVDALVPGSFGYGVVDIGPGTFDYPVIRTQRLDKNNLVIALVGDRGSPTLSFVTPPAFSTVAGKATYSEATVDPFAGVGNATHWLENDFSFFIPFGSVALASSSPTLQVFSTFHTAVRLHPYATTLVCRGDAGFVSNVGDLDQRVHLYNVGCEIQGGFDCRLHGATLSGCRVVATVGDFHLIDCELSDTATSFGGGRVVVTAAKRRDLSCSILVLGQTVLHLGSFFLTPLIRSATNNPLSIGSSGPSIEAAPASVFCGNLDAESAVANVVRLDNADWRGNVADISVSSNPTTFMTLTRSKARYASGSIDGQTSGPCLVLDSDCSVDGFKAVCDGKLTTTGGNEVDLGGVGVDFADFPLVNLDRLVRADR